MPRLTRAQYDNTIRELVQLNTQPSSMLAPDSVGSVDERAWEGYQTAAESLADQIMADPTARAAAIPCTPTGNDDAACAGRIISEFGPRVFRRPLTGDEIAAFQSLFDRRAELTETGTFDEAARLIIKSFLVSPSFLARTEIAATPAPTEGRFQLSSYEVASRLSYMLWGSMPDGQLFEAAAADQLQTPENILAQARRMLQDDRARSKVGAFHELYAHMGEGTRWAAIQRDATLYPSFTEAMVPMLSEETRRFFDHVVFTGGSFKDLLLSPVAFVNSSLAPIYGLDPSAYGTDMVQVNLDPAVRPGAFTRAGFLTAYSLFNRPSAILRGAFIQKELLCTVIGAPPDDAESTPQSSDPSLVTNRQRTDDQTKSADCAGCHHVLINPTGFTMESFDAIGAFQLNEKDTGAAIDTNATVPIGANSVTVTGAAGLMEAIANSPEAQRCYAQQWVQYAYERVGNPEDSCTVDVLASKLTRDGYTVVDLIADLTQTDSFRYRALETAEVSP